MKKYIKFFVLLLGSLAYSQSTIKGTVSDEKNKPIPMSNVVIVGSNVGTTTDMNGNYSITTNLAGEQVVKIANVGYAGQSKTITLPGDITVNFVLTESVQALDEVVLTATSTKRSQKETPLSITSLGTKELSKLGTSSQADILMSVPGITAEGGGGEVASNIFVRGLPSGGQYQFNPLQIDGMPVLSTFGLNSSAHDVYFRNDLGIKSLEFLRGGSSILYGVGSVAGIINYTSVTGGPTSETKLRTEMASNSRYKLDFVTSGQLGGENSDLFYALSGFYRYDEGPIKTGLASEGFQLRGNIKKITKNGSITISGQVIDDQVQFYLPYPLKGGSRERPVGNDGNTIYTLQTAAASDISYKTPDGIYNSNIEDGSSTKGSYILANFKNNFENDYKLDANIRYSKYNHEFNLFLDGSGVTGAKVVETQAEYLAARALTTGSFTYLNGQALPANAKLFENRILDRDRPIREMVSDIKLTKKAGNHTITVGTFMSRSSAGDLNVTTRYLGEYNDRPELVNVSNYSVNGVTGRGIGYSNKNISSNKVALFLADEIKLNRWNFDFGVRYERASGDIENEGSAIFTVDNTGRTNLDNVRWGNGKWTRAHVAADDFALALAGLYKVNDNLSAYGNFSSGYFFPELRSVKFDGLGNPNEYDTEKINQFEAGVKYGKGSFSGTAALYGVSLKDRRNVTFVNAPGGGFVEDVDIQDTKTIGLETTWKWRFAKNVTLNGSLTYQDHEITLSDTNPAFVGNKLGRQPKVLSMFGLDYDNKKLDASFVYNYTGKKFTNDANTIELDAMGIANVNLGYTISTGNSGENVRFGTQVFNLFNSTGISEGSPRLNNNQTEEEYFVGRPILPTRVFFNATFTF